MRSRLWRAAVIAVACVLANAALAEAGTAGHWTRLTDVTASNIDEVSLARTPDGMLHAAWTRPTPSNPGLGRDLLVRAISPSGALGAAAVVASNWATMANPSLLTTGGDGLDVFLGAMRSTSAGDTNANLSLFTSADGGASWVLFPSDLTNTDAAYSSNVSAALGSDGTPFITWGSSNCLCVHRGIAQTPNSDFQQGLGDFGYEPGIALDPSTGRLVAAWYSNGTGHDGVYAATVDQSTGGLSGPQVRMPGTSNLSDGPFSERTQIVARTGGGLYVAYEGGYPAHTKLLLWHVGAAQSTLLAHNPLEVRSVGVAATPSGRLWVFWSSRSSSGSPIVYARRSNSAASAWGATVVVKPPAHAGSSWNLVGNGQADRLDLVGSFSTGSSNAIASYHTQVLPGLALAASPTHLHVKTASAKKVTFSASDAGVGVGGVQVRVGHVKGTTNGKGNVTLTLGPFAHPTHLLAVASQSHYAPVSLSLTVK